MMVVAQGVALAATLFYAGADAVAVIGRAAPCRTGNVAAYGAVTGLMSRWRLRRGQPARIWSTPRPSSGAPTRS
jgi:hypothetical protein